MGHSEEIGRGHPEKKNQRLGGEGGGFTIRKKVGRGGEGRDTLRREKTLERVVGIFTIMEDEYMEPW